MPSHEYKVAYSFHKAAAKRLYYDWGYFARDSQKPPPGDWTTWLLMGGRGSGKTRAGAEWVRSLAANRVSPIALVGETISEAVSIMIHGESGIMRVTPLEDRPVLRDNRVLWPNGAEGMVLGASDPERFRGPQFAAAWCDELGCAAVDKGANQPNIFGDPKSAESGRPYFSNGKPDGLMQRQFLRAHLRHWEDVGVNPPGMVDPDRIYLWTWDARPYPAFPALTDVWADGENHHTGHWLTGRLGAAAGDELARAIAADHGVALGDVAAEGPLIPGCRVAGPGTARAALEPLLEATGQGLRVLADGIGIGRADERAEVTVSIDGMVAAGDAGLSRRRPDAGEAVGRLVLSFVDRERDYLAGSVTALRTGEGAVEAAESGLTLDLSAARAAAETMLGARDGDIETLEFALPPSAMALDIGDTIEIAGLAEGPFEVTEITDGAARRVRARGVAPKIVVKTEAQRPMAGRGAVTRARPLLVAAHLPPLPEVPSQSRLALGAFAEPWPGTVTVEDEATGAQLAVLSRRAVIGTVIAGIAAGPEAVWDIGSVLEVKLHWGHLNDAGDAGALAGTRRVAVETESGWELVAFAQAELVAPSTYQLTRLLRGQAGTASGRVVAGGAVMLLDERVTMLAVPPQWLGSEIAVRVYGGAGDLAGMAEVLDIGVAPLLPLAPAHLAARRDAVSGDIDFSWIRRSRTDAGNWATEPALEHAPEGYVLTISEGDAVRRMVEVGAAGWRYAADAQAEDFGGLAGNFTFTVAQVSPVLGAGFAAEGVFDG